MLAPFRRSLVVLALVAPLVGAPAAFASDPAGGELDPHELPSGPAAPRATDLDPADPGGTAGADPNALITGEQRLQAAAPGDLWAVSDAAATPIDALWSAERGAYLIRNAPRARLNAEMLLAHSYAALAGHQGVTGRPDRIEPLVRLMTGPMYLATLDGKVTPAPSGGHSQTVHAPGFTEPGGAVVTQHQALDAVVMRALAAAWRARDIVGLSAEARNLIYDRVVSVARSPFWASPSRLLNQINWNADVYAADATVTGDPVLLQRDYRQQLLWFIQNARREAYPKGTSNLASGLGFHYLPNRVPSNQTNRSDTAEYANITLGALAYYDQALAAGMQPLPPQDQQLLRDWTRRVAYGNWTTSGYLNWDSGKSVQRLYLTQYWMLALRGFAAGTTGAIRGGLIPNQQATARWLTQAAVQHYQQAAADSNSVVLPASAYGFSGSALVSDNFDGLTGTARLASTTAELANSGLAAANGPGARLPNAYAHDEDLGRLAITTSRYATAFLAPWAPLQVGGLEPSRLFDARGRALTGVGGNRDGTLGLRISAGPSTLIETQPGVRRKAQSGLKLPKGAVNASKPLGKGLTVTGADSADSVLLKVSHTLKGASLRTTYTVTNDRKSAITADLRLPTYGVGTSGNLTIGQQLSAGALKRQLTLKSPTGATYLALLSGLPPRATGKVIRVPSGQRGNPTPGPQLRVRVTLPKKSKTKIVRLLTVPAPG